MSLSSCYLSAKAYVGLSQVFRQTKRKTEGPQHFAFPEISRENRGCLVLHSVSLEFPSGNSRVSLSLRAGLGQNLGQNLGNRQTARVFSRYTRGFSRYARKKYPGVLPIWLIWGPKTSLSAQSDSAQSPKFDYFRWSFPRKLEGALRKLAGNTERKPGRALVKGVTLVTDLDKI